MTSALVFHCHRAGAEREGFSIDASQTLDPTNVDMLVLRGGRLVEWGRQAYELPSSCSCLRAATALNGLLMAGTKMT